VLDDGRVGVLFPTGDVAALAAALIGLLADDVKRTALCDAGSRWVRRYDWETVASDLMAVYETVKAGAGAVVEDERRGWRDRLRR
jgi:phosphatidylinositol alpha-mannosyltransferase